MGTGCSAEMSKAMAQEKCEMKDEEGKLARGRNRARKQSTTSSSDVNVKVTKPKQWKQPVPTPVAKVVPPTSELSAEENSHRLSTSIHQSGSDVPSVTTTKNSNSTTGSTTKSSNSITGPTTKSSISTSGSATKSSISTTGSATISSNSTSGLTTKSSNNLSSSTTKSNNSSSGSTTSSSTTTVTSKLREQWKTPPRLASMTRDMQDLLLGHQKNASTLIPPAKVIHLKVIAPGEECMKERLTLWSKTFMPLRMFCAENGYVLDIQDDLWSSTNLDKAYTHLLSIQGDQIGATDQSDDDNDDDDTKDNIDVLLVILDDVYRYRLPAVLSHEDYTLVLVSLPDSSITALFHDLYANNENRAPPAFELKHHVMIRQDEAKLTHLVEVMLEVYRRENKDVHMFNSDYCKQIFHALLQKHLLTNRTVIVSKIEDNIPENKSNPCASTQESSNPHAEMNKRHVNVFVSIKNECPSESIIELTLLQTQNTEENCQTTGPDVNTTRLHDMSLTVKMALEKIITKVMEQKDGENRFLVTGVPRSLAEELVTQSKHWKRLINVKPILESPTLTSLQDYLLTVSEMPIVMYAETGWGVSTMGAQLVKSCIATMPKSAIIYRSMGISPDSRTLMSTLLSIQEQLDTILGPPARGKETEQMPAAETLLRDIVTRSSSNVSIMIILEGISLVSAQLKELDIMTLTELLPTTTKLLVMTSDPDVARGLRTKMKDAFYVKAIPWEKQIIVDLFTSKLAARKRNLTDSQNSAVTAAIHNCPLPMYATLAVKLASSWRALTEITNDDLPSTLDEMISKLFDHLERCIPSSCLSAMMAYLTGSVGGICKWEMADLLSVNDSVLLTIYSDVRDPPVHRAPPILWKFISTYLRDHLSRFISKDFYTYFWTSGSLRKCAAAKYSSTNSTVHKEISDHFQGRWAGKRKPYPDPQEEIELLQDRFIMPQPDKYGQYFNVRKFLCLPHHMINSKNQNAYTLETCIFNLPWTEHKLNSTSALQVVCDLEQAKSMEASPVTEIKAMQQAILMSASQLTVHGREIYKCLRNHAALLPDSADTDTTNKLRIKSTNGLAAFYAWLSKPPGPFLYPLDDLPVSLNQLQNSAIIIGAIIPLSTDPHEVHSALVLKSEGEIKIVNTVTNTTERTLTGIDQPQTLKMLDSTRAVVLCNRELVIIDLDEGRLMTKLRGVLNLKLPLFGLQSDKKVVALSRDRMVVNILDIDTGGIVATFKAGETRFLDSLIISGDGKVLVCGDETQKPFPLLVWSLEQAKLLHDIRMPHHDFITSLAAITDNGQYLACGCKEVNDTKSNFIVVYDLVSGHLFKKFKMTALSTALAMSTQTMSIVIGLDTGQLSVWDLVSGNHKFQINGARTQIDSIDLTPNGKMCLTTCKEEFSISSHSLSVWDIDQGTFVACHTFDAPISCAHLTSDGHLVLSAVKGHASPIRLLLVPEGHEVMEMRDELETEKDAAAAVFGDIARKGKIIAINFE